MYFTKLLYSFKYSKYFLNKWYKILVGSNNDIKGLIITIETKASTQLPNKKGGLSNNRSTSPNKAFIYQITKSLLKY